MATAALTVVATATVSVTTPTAATEAATATTAAAVVIVASALRRRKMAFQLLDAAERGETLRVRRLLDNGAPVDCRGIDQSGDEPIAETTPLMFAAKQGGQTTSFTTMPVRRRSSRLPVCWMPVLLNVPFNRVWIPSMPDPSTESSPGI